MIKALAHADIRAVIRRQYEQANFTVTEANGIAQRRLLHFEKLEDVLVEAGDLSGLGGANDDVIELTRLLPAVFLVALSYFLVGSF